MKTVITNLNTTGTNIKPVSTVLNTGFGADFFYGCLYRK